MAVGPQNVGLPGYRPGDAQPRRQPLANPWNINIPGSGLASNNGHGGAIPLVNPPAPVAPAAPAEPPAPPPDYWALAGVDPQYTMGQGLLDRRNTMNLQSLEDAWKRQGQSAQDSWNAHGALFSGGAIHAQQYNDQQHSNAVAQETLSHDQGLNDLRWGVFNRLVAQAANPIGA